MTVFNNVDKEGNANLERLNIHDPTTCLAQDFWGRKALINVVLTRLFNKFLYPTQGKETAKKNAHWMSFTYHKSMYQKKREEIYAPEYS